MREELAARHVACEVWLKMWSEESRSMRQQHAGKHTGGLAARHVAKHVGRDVAGDVGRYMREHAQKQAAAHWAGCSARLERRQIAGGATGRQRCIGQIARCA